MNAVFAAHDEHGWLPHHVLEAAGESLGVAARSVETRYGLHLATLDAASRWQLGPAEIAMTAEANHFIDAYVGLVYGGHDVPPYPLFDHAVWRSPHPGLTRLRLAESRRRQAISEWGKCFYCWPEFRLAVDELARRDARVNGTGEVQR